MAERPVRVVAIVRHRGHLLRCAEVAEDGSNSISIARDPRLPSLAVGHGDDVQVGLGGLLDSLGIAHRSIDRRGDPVETPAGPTVPFLVTVEDRTGVTSGAACSDPTWVRPVDLRRHDSELGWRIYREVAPTVETVAADEQRGSTAIATDALWVLRDVAVDVAATGDGLSPVATTARELIAARPGMAALETRVDRAMSGATTPEAVATAASAGIDRVHAADAAAARLAASTVAGDRVLTLSRSGTVRAALVDARLDVIVAASRPGGEGLTVADDLVAAGVSASTCADADIYERLRNGAIDTVLVGADGVTPDGALVNKVGTWAAALGASWVDVPTFAVCAADKVWPASVGTSDLWPRIEPMFDLTPSGFVTGIFTERGRLEPTDVRTVAEEHRELAAWRR